MEHQLAADDFSSGQFKFIVGHERKEFSIHASVVAREFKVPSSLDTGPFEEAHEGSVVWTHVDADTFADFATFCYTGDYGPDYGGVPDNVAPDYFDEVPDGIRIRISPIYESRYSYNDRLANIFRHAKLYVFAACYDIDMLWTEAYFRLHQALKVGSKFPRANEILFKLVGYAYENTPYNEAATHDLRSLVHKHIAPRVQALWALEDFRNLLKNNKFAVGLIETMMKLDD